MKTVPAAWAKARGSSRSYKIKSKSSRLPPLLQGVEALAVAFDLAIRGPSVAAEAADKTRRAPHRDVRRFPRGQDAPRKIPPAPRTRRSEEHTSELQSLMRISYADFCLKTKKYK